MLFSSAQSEMVQVNLYLGLLKGNHKNKGKISSWIIMVWCGVWELSIHDVIIGAKWHTGEYRQSTGRLLASYSVHTSWPVLCALKQGTQVKLLWVPAKLSNVIPHPLIPHSALQKHRDCSLLYYMLIKFASKKEKQSHVFPNLYDFALSYLSLEYKNKNFE